MAVNFLDQWKSGKGTIGKKAWTNALAAGFSPQQIKVAVQQQNQAGVGVNNAPGQFFHGGSNPMRGVAGMHSAANPLGKYQGSGGNLGLKAYTAARQEFSGSEINKHLAASGMFLPIRASAQNQMDLQNEQQQARMAEFQSMYQQQMEAQQKAANTVSTSASYAVGSGGNAALKSKSVKKRSDNVRKRWGRGGAGFQSALNAGAGAAAGAAAGSGSAGKSLNV
jgi:hypothetical protein